MTPLDKQLAQHGELERHPCPSWVFKISAGEQVQTYALDQAATGTGYSLLKRKIKRLMISCAIFWSYFFECQLEVILIIDGSHSLP
jgi:hypothetical protein